MKPVSTIRMRPSQTFAWAWTAALALAAGCAANEPPARLAPIRPEQPFTFAVLGDNRGDDTGEQPPAFRQIVQAVQAAAPGFVFNTGDMIYGRTWDESVARAHWRGYQEAIAPLRMPIFHVPGNHDIWSEASARLYRELWGPTWYAFDHGPARFIALDSETLPCRLGPAQFAWLKRQLEDAGPPVVFIFLHRPLFPVDGAIGSSMDAYPAERDALHQLFVRHRRRIKGVFLGHEHLHHFHERDGVPYHITGGGGAPLYMAPELGGFHHFLLVRVAGERVTTELKKTGPPWRPRETPRVVAAGELLEGWEEGLFGFAWNYSVTTEITPDRASHGRRGLRLNFDLEQYPWPVLALTRPTPWDLRTVEALSVDVFVPGDLAGPFSLTAAVEGTGKHEAPPVALQRGWNTVRLALNDTWLPPAARGAVRVLGWSLSADRPRQRGSVVFDNLRLERRGLAGGTATERLESWERPLLWRVGDETVGAEITPQFHTEGRRAVKMHFDFRQCARPVLLARLNPPWDLRRVDTLAADVFLPDEVGGPVSVTFGLRSREVESPAPPVPLRPGWNTVRVDLNGPWLPPATRAAAEQVQWTVSSSNPVLAGWIVFDHLRAEGSKE